MKWIALLFVIFVLAGCKGEENDTSQPESNPIVITVESTREWEYNVNDSLLWWNGENRQTITFDMDSVFFRVRPTEPCPYHGGLKLISSGDTAFFPTNLGGCGSAYVRNLWRVGIGALFGRDGIIEPPQPPPAIMHSANVQADSTVVWELTWDESEFVNGIGSQYNIQLDTGAMCVQLTAIQADGNDIMSLSIYPDSIADIATIDSNFHCEVCVE